MDLFGLIEETIHGDPPLIEVDLSDGVIYLNAKDENYWKTSF